MDFFILYILKTNTGKMDIINYFKDNLKDSEMYEKELNDFYSTHIKGFDKIKVVKFDQKGRKFQLLGIDKVILLKPKRYIKIEEKIRFKTFQQPDIFLEDISNIKMNTLGWINKKQNSDIIVYYIVPLNTIYIMNTKTLQKIYKIYKQEWLSKYCWNYAKNEGYDTKGICVPFEELEKVMNIKKFTI